MNLFTQTQTFAQAGLFVAVGPQTSTANIAEKICTALSQKIAENKMPLDQNWWEQCVSNIPNQVDTLVANKISKTQVSGKAITSEIARLCLPAIPSAAPKKTAISQVTNYIGSLPTLTSFNCLVISALDQNKITLSLSFFTITKAENTGDSTVNYEITVNKSDSAVNMTNATNIKQINDIFGSFSVITGEEYYVSIQQEQPALQSK